MWGIDEWGWGLGMLVWMIVVWALVLIGSWMIFRNIGGPKHHHRH